MQRFFTYLKGKLKQDMMSPNNWVFFIIIEALLFLQLARSQVNMGLKIALAVIYILLIPLSYVFVNLVRYWRHQNKSK